MGMSCDYTCTDCGLSGHVSGGIDRGFIITVQTVYCKQCDELVDVRTELRSRLTGKKEPLTQQEAVEIGQCNHCKSYPDIKWNNSEPCPKCGGSIERDTDGMMLIWD